MTTYTARAQLQMPARADRLWDVPLLADLVALDGVNAIGAFAVTLHEVPSTSLNVVIAPGSFRKGNGAVVSYAGTASQAIAASSTQVLYLTNAGTLTVASAFPTSGLYYPLAIVTTGTTTITAIVDARPSPTILSASPTVGTATLVAGTVAVAATNVTASTLVFLSRKTIGGTTGMLSYTVTAGTGFTVTSSSSSDTSSFAWQLVEP